MDLQNLHSTTGARSFAEIHIYWFLLWDFAFSCVAATPASQSTCRQSYLLLTGNMYNWCTITGSRGSIKQVCAQNTILQMNTWS